jgi:hypothetical protein
MLISSRELSQGMKEDKKYGPSPANGQMDDLKTILFKKFLDPQIDCLKFINFLLEMIEDKTKLLSAVKVLFYRYIVELQSSLSKDEYTRLLGKVDAAL